MVHAVGFLTWCNDPCCEISNLVYGLCCMTSNLVCDPCREIFNLLYDPCFMISNLVCYPCCVISTKMCDSCCVIPTQCKVHAVCDFQPSLWSMLCDFFNLEYDLWCMISNLILYSMLFDLQSSFSSLLYDFRAPIYSMLVTGEDFLVTGDDDGHLKVSLTFFSCDLTFWLCENNRKWLKMVQ